MQTTMIRFVLTSLLAASTCSFAEDPTSISLLWELGAKQTVQASPQRTGWQLIAVAEGHRPETVRSAFLGTFAAPNIVNLAAESDGSEIVAAERARRFVRLGLVLDGGKSDDAQAESDLKARIRATEDRMLRMTENEREKLINPATNQQYTDRELNEAYARAQARYRYSGPGGYYGPGGAGINGGTDPSPPIPTPTPPPQVAGLIWPVAKSAPMGDGFGPRGTHPVTGAPNAMHRGIDFSGPTGSPIFASDAGTVIQAQSNCTVGDHACGGGWGNHIIIDHGNGLKTVYAHLDTLNFSQGQEVNQGDMIGGMGNTGSSTGPHLHFEVWKNDVRVDPLAHLPTR